MSPSRAIAALPLPVLYALASATWPWLYYVGRYRRAVVRQNLLCAFPELDSSARRGIEKRFYRQLVDVAVEIIASQRMSLDDFGHRVSVENPELLERLRADFDRPVLVLTVHQGNWEWMLHATHAALGVPMDPVYKPLHNARVDRLMQSVRSRFGARPLPLKSATRDILKRREGFRLLALVADQSPTRREKGLWTTFMGRPAAFHTGAASLARSAGFPVVFARCRRLRRGYYQLRFTEIARPPYGGDGAGSGDTVNAITLRYAQLAESAIREEPESWLWSNRRWKREPAAGETVY